MVLEHLFPESWLEKKFGFAFVLGAFYSLVGIFVARLLFGANSGITSVIFTSLLLIPSLRKLFVREEKREEKEKRFSLRELYRDNAHLIKTYVGIFIGVFFMYYLLSYLAMVFGWNIMSIFREQIFLDPAISGRASFMSGMFWSILANNWWVLLACFLLSLISGDGATFFVVWNASAWAVIFAIRGVAAAGTLQVNPLGTALLMLLIALPHILLEGGAYVLAGIADAVISDDVVSRAKELRRFIPVFLILVAVFLLLDKLLQFFLAGAGLSVLRILVVMGLLFVLKFAFDDKKHKEVFIYNYWLFVIALGVFIIGAIVETAVLSNSMTLNHLYDAATLFFL